MPAGGDYTLTKIELAVSLVTGSNELDVWLMSDNAGASGAVIESFHFSDAMGPIVNLNPPLAADSVLCPTLQDVTQYWLVASATGPDAWALWNWNSIDDIGTFAQRRDMSDCYVSTNVRPVCRISETLGTKVDVDIDIRPEVCVTGNSIRSLLQSEFGKNYYSRFYRFWC